MAATQYFGKYRAQVTDVNDPEQRGRIRVLCPKVLGHAKSAWCEVCVPFAGEEEGDFALPNVGEMVWVEFEGGDANAPIYVGGWYSKGRSPKQDYNDAPNERIIGFKGARISLRQTLTALTYSNNVSGVNLTGPYLTAAGTHSTQFDTNKIDFLNWIFDNGNQTAIKTLVSYLSDAEWIHQQFQFVQDVVENYGTLDWVVSNMTNLQWLVSHKDDIANAISG